MKKKKQKKHKGFKTQQTALDINHQNFPIGAGVRGKVREMTVFGAVIEFEEGITGWVHVYDISWTRKVNHPSEVLKMDDEVDAIILGVVDADVLGVNSNNQRISLGMKQVGVDPWSKIDAVFKVGDVVQGTVAKITSFGAFVELKDGIDCLVNKDVIDGLVHITQIGEEHIEKVEDVLKVGQQVRARVIKIDREERRIGLSIRAMNYLSEQIAAEISAYEALSHTAGNDMMATPAAPGSIGSPSSETEWLRGIMAEAPWLFDQKDSGRVIKAYTLPGTAEEPPESPVPRLLRRKLSDITLNGRGLKQRVSEYVERLITRTDIPLEKRAAYLAYETSEAMGLATDLAIAFTRANNTRASVDNTHLQMAQSVLSVVREFAALAKEGYHDAVFHLIKIAEEAIAGLEGGGPQLEEVVRVIAPSRAQWPQLCGALPEDRDRVQVRLRALGVGTMTTVRKSYGGRGRPISYDSTKTPVNAVAASLIQYIVGIRRQCAMAAGTGVDSEISQTLVNNSAALPEFNPVSAKEWVRVAEEIVKECCGMNLEGIPGLVSEDARRSYERRRAVGDELFDSEIRDNVRASLMQSFKTIALPGAR